MIEVSREAVRFVFSFAHEGAIEAASPCTADSPNRVVDCPGPPPTQLKVLAGDGADRVTLNYTEDSITPALVFAAFFEGGRGDDRLAGGAEHDTLRGGLGDDTLGLSSGGDDLRGEDGSDTASVVGYAAGADVALSLDDIPNDGATGESANAHRDIENVTGGPANETVIGNAGYNVISTGRGGDVIDGAGGTDDLAAGAGIDRILARDGVTDRVDCGPDFDTVVSDTIDVTPACEGVSASSELEPDRDHDGFPGQLDCNDLSESVRPGANEVLGNGIDEDCDGHDRVNLDLDGDGYSTPADCDDGVSSIRPGVAEVFGNSRDEDCNGRADPFQALTPALSALFRVRGRGTRVTGLSVRNLPVGTRVRVGCRGHGCPFRSITRVSTARGVNISKRMRKARLRLGAVLEVSLSRRDSLTTVYRFRARVGSTPRVQQTCARPDNNRPVPCEPPVPA